MHHWGLSPGMRLMTNQCGPTWCIHSCSRAVSAQVASPQHVTCLLQVQSSGICQDPRIDLAQDHTSTLTCSALCCAPADYVAACSGTMMMHGPSMQLHCDGVV